MGHTQVHLWDDVGNKQKTKKGLNDRPLVDYVDDGAELRLTADGSRHGLFAVIDRFAVLCGGMGFDGLRCG